MARYLAVRLIPEDHDALTRYRLQIGAQVGRNIPAGKFVALLLEVAKLHTDNLVSLARRSEDASEER